MKITSLLVTILLTLIGWWLIFPILNTVSLPIRDSHNIISYLTIRDRSPATNIAIYLSLLLLPSLSIFLFYSIRKYLPTSIISDIEEKISNFRQIEFLPLLLLVTIPTWIATSFQLTKDFAIGVARDGFHFGEKIGLSKTFLKAPDIFFEKAYILIHGFGQNVLPGVIGFWLGGQNRDISVSLFVVHLQTVFSVIFSFLILFEVASFISLKYRWRVLLIFTLLYFSLHGIIFNLIDRDTVFMVQLFVLLRWLRLDSSQQDKHNGLRRDFIYFFLLGLSLPVSILYVYDRATYSIIVFLALFSYLLLTRSKIFMLVRAAVFVISALLCSLMISLWLGWQAIPVSIQHIIYWTKFAGLFTALPYPKIIISIGTLVDWVPIFLQSLTLTLLCLELRNQCFVQKNSLRTFLRENCISIFMLLSAMLFMRVALGRSDAGHLISPGFFSIYAFSATVGSYAIRRNLPVLSWHQVLSGFLVFSLLVNLNSVAAAVNVKSIFSYPRLSSAFINQRNQALLDPRHIETVDQIRPDLKGQSCFYSLTSEGLWYRLLSKRPCSKYWYLIYAIPPKAQQELIEDLQQTKPKIILYANASLGNAIDEVNKETSHLKVHQYVWQHYQPYKLIGDNWFWIRRKTEIPLSSLLTSSSTPVAGFFDDLSFPNKNAGLDVVASGWLAPFEMQQTEQPVILLTYNLQEQPETSILLGLGRASSARTDVVTALNRLDALQSGWTITFNRLNLPEKVVEIKAWAYNPKDAKFYSFPEPQILKPIEFESTKR